jgi:hypothetical protein
MLQRCVWDAQACNNVLRIVAYGDRDFSLVGIVNSNESVAQVMAYVL